MVLLPGRVADAIRFNLLYPELQSGEGLFLSYVSVVVCYIFCSPSLRSGPSNNFGLFAERSLGGAFLGYACVTTS